jgi:hypothetical protein
MSDTTVDVAALARELRKPLETYDRFWKAINQSTDEHGNRIPGRKAPDPQDLHDSTMRVLLVLARNPDLHFPNPNLRNHLGLNLYTRLTEIDAYLIDRLNQVYEERIAPTYATVTEAREAFDRGDIEVDEFDDCVALILGREEQS